MGGLIVYDRLYHPIPQSHKNTSRRSMISEEGSASITNDEKEETGVPPIGPEVGKSKYGVNIKHLLQVMMFYGLSTYLALS